MEQNGLPLPYIPTSTYRLQFNNLFTFRDAARIIPYLHDLGITDIYSSPYFKAKKGSLHGYDIVDHGALNPEIGTDEEYSRMIAELHLRNMGQILDIVPNHMCVESSENRWWMDVLENGPASVYAGFFDIDWNPVKKELRNKVLIPILGDQYGNVLERGEFSLTFEEGAFFINYYDNRFPLRLLTYIAVLEHRLAELESRLTDGNPDIAELLSVMFALKNLPSHTETDPEKIAERYREKKIIKRRLSSVTRSNNEIRRHIERNVLEFNGKPGEPRSFDLLDELMNRQIFRLSYWRVATEEINYRRFFDINSIGAIRMENPDVFRETHELVFKLIKNNSVTGLRVDHPDGLYNPVEYFQRLQKGCFIAMQQPRDEESERELGRRYDQAVAENPGYMPYYIVGEKILTKSERLPEDWPIFSTTGYVFANSVNGIFIEAAHGKAFDKIYEKFVGRRFNVYDIIYDKKRLVLRVAMSSEVNTLGHYLSEIAEKKRSTRDFTLYSLTNAVVSTIAAFPVYRTYINTWSISERDHQVIELAISKAKRQNPAISASIFDFLRDVLLLKVDPAWTQTERQEYFEFVLKFQQITGPVMAKGVEDTAFYVYNRFVSQNEVGGMPERFGIPLETFHGQNIERRKSWPHAMIATATHDTKRSADVRARINVLSEMPGEWGRKVRSWARMNKKERTNLNGSEVPDRNEEYFLYQTLIGALPVNHQDQEIYAAFISRIREYMIKAVREAKMNTSWINPDQEYEQALLSYIDGILDPSGKNEFLRDFIPFQEMISHYGMFNSLSQTLLKICSPGVPDFYQGTELWDFSLVDPDNRRPVDYALRMKLLEELKEREATINRAELAKSLSFSKKDGKAMLYLVYRALNYRRSKVELFQQGDYQQLEAEGLRERHICAFMRRSGKKMFIAANPRFLTGLIPRENSAPLGEEVWKDTRLAISDVEPGATFRNVFTDEIVVAAGKDGNASIPLAEMFANFPVALMEKI